MHLSLDKLQTFYKKGSVFLSSKHLKQEDRKIPGDLRRRPSRFQLEKNIKVSKGLPRTSILVKREDGEKLQGGVRLKELRSSNNCKENPGEDAEAGQPHYDNDHKFNYRHFKRYSHAVEIDDVDINITPLLGKFSIEKESLVALPYSGTNVRQIMGRGKRRKTDPVGASEFMKDKAVQDYTSYYSLHGTPLDPQESRLLGLKRS